LAKRSVARVILPVLSAIVLLTWRWERAGQHSVIVTYWGRPSEVLQYLMESAWGELATSVLLCFQTAVVSLIAAGVLAVALLMAGALSSTGLRLIERFAALSQTIPTLVIVTIFLLLERQIATAFHLKPPLMLYCLGPVTVSLLFPPLVNGAEGIAQLPIDVKYLLRLWAAPRWVRIWRVYIPAALPYILTGVRTSATWAVGATLLTEGLLSAVEGISLSLGHILLRASSAGVAARATSVFIIATALALAVYGLAVLAQRMIERIVLGPTAMTQADYPLQTT